MGPEMLDGVFTELTGGTHFPGSDTHSRAHLAAVELMAAIDDACRVEQWIGSHEERRQNAAAYRRPPRRARDDAVCVNRLVCAAVGRASSGRRTPRAR